MRFCVPSSLSNMEDCTALLGNESKCLKDLEALKVIAMGTR